ncbi:MAG: hypothetical protein U5N26_07810 [Candidatus Marinimicrobia bacterium]|nr:hypothetical protein [Candidatus Neomarinimicrobiota bacterium]
MEESPAFTNAISSTSPFDGNYDGEPDRYTLPFLAPGSYDLILAGVNAEGDILVSNISDHTDIAVSSKNNTTVNITF